MSLMDKNGNVLSDFNSRIYGVIPATYGSAVEPYVDVVNGKAKVEFVTSTVA